MKYKSIPTDVYWLSVKSMSSGVGNKILARDFTGEGKTIPEENNHRNSMIKKWEKFDA